MDETDEINEINIRDIPAYFVEGFKNKFDFAKINPINNVKELAVHYDYLCLKNKRYGWFAFVEINGSYYNEYNQNVFGFAVDIRMDEFDKSSYNIDEMTKLIRNALEEYLCLKKEH